MLQGKTDFLGKGYWREVRRADYKGREVAIKTLRDNQEETKRNLERHRWEAVALDMVRLPLLKPRLYLPETLLAVVGL